MGRAPCCDKANVKKGPWSPEEDGKLKAYINQHGTGGNWIALPQKIGLKRCGKSCRLRWLNYLRPNIKHGGFSEEEDNIICSLYISIGSRWSIIAAQLPGRTDNDIKNYWNTKLKKKLLGKQRKDHKQAKVLKQMNPTANNTNIYSDTLIPQQYHPRVTYDPHQLPPIPYTNHEPRFSDDHTSIRKLLIKLGGRFSDHIVNSHEQQILKIDHDIQYPESSSSVLAQPVDHVYNPSIDFMPNDSPQVPNLLVDTTSGAPLINATTHFNMLHGSSSVVHLYENPQKLQGLDQSFYDDMINSSIDWGEMNSLVFPASTTNNITELGFIQGSAAALGELGVDNKMSYPQTQ